ncbi:FAD-dependent oxidoreductase [Amylolactobacillus amylophilus]|uniref:FAD-dependent oxidoreductase n=1 Tax=Amylolactobacillus amylophilus TaxID=1603 RepID=UPI0034E2F750
MSSNIKRFHNEITAVVNVEDGKLTSVRAENVSDRTIGAVGIETWLNKANAEGSVEVDAISGASISTGALRSAAQAAFASATGQETDAVSGASQQQVGTKTGRPAPANYPLLKSRVYSKDVNYIGSYDVIVVGSGGAGLAAAATAAENNAQVLVIEKAGIAGGTTNYSGGVLQAAGTKWQKEFTKDESDTPERHEAEYMKTGEGRLYRDLVHDFTQNAPANMEWLAKMGVQWTGVYGHTTIPYATEDFAERIHISDNGGGAGDGIMLTQHLLKYALSLGAQIRYNTAVIGLIEADEHNHAVTGVVVSDGRNLEYLEARRGVVLATASVDQNVELAKDLSPQHYADVSAHRCWSVKTDRGDGIVLGMKLGAAVTGFGGTIDFDARTGNGTNNQIPTIPSIFVNGNGLDLLMKKLLMLTFSVRFLTKRRN